MALQRLTAQVVRREYITPTVFEIDFKPSEPLLFKPGQFLMVKFKNPENPEKTLSRSYSIASCPEKEVLTLCVKIVLGGVGTNFLNTIEIGSTVDLTGPFGRFTYHSESPKIPFFISTGTGVAPYVSMTQSQIYQDASPKETICLHGVRQEEEILYEEILSQVPGLKFIATVSRPTENWKGFKGRVTDYLKEISNSFDWNSADFYLCGNGSMIKEVKTFLAEKGVPKESVHQEIYYTEKEPKSAPVS